jgi:sigma-B regulation protein RsbU (phosphoserine phosphatase)
VIPPVSRSAIYGLERGPWILALILCLGLACWRPCAQAQGLDASNLREPTDLAAGWLVHGGDDPAYARPDFDDSQWTPFNANKQDLHELFPKSRPEVVWYRLHVNVAPSHIGLTLLERNIENAFEVYADGEKLLQVGRIAPFIPYTIAAHILLSIPEGQIETRSVVIALRVHISPADWEYPLPGYYSANLTIGQASALRNLMWLEIIGGRAVEWLDLLLNFCMLLGGILLYSTQRNRTEYFWLCIWSMTWFLLLPSATYGLLHAYPAGYDLILSGMFGVIGPYAYARMYCAFVEHRVDWKLQFFLAITSVVTCCANLATYVPLLAKVPFNLLSGPLVLLTSVVIPLIVLAHVRRNGYSEAVLLVPVLLIGIYFLTSQIAFALTTVPIFRDRAFMLVSLTLGKQIGPVNIPYQYLTDILAKLSLALIVLVRTNRMSRQQALFESEFASAREVQQVILPESVESIPGFRIESVYEPAREVGGDFFQILPVAESGMLLVIGDVAGKGLPAAMLVSVLVGAIRSVAEFTHAPDQILIHLNQRMMGRTNGGFSTALAAYFDVDGSATIANAGHLSPYLDGREIELPSALPLGIISSASYESVQLCLEPGSRLMFYTDGVIEAQDKQGHLFGFERGKAISTQPAAQIVKTAQEFGQTDDITVVAIQREARVRAESCDELIRREPVIPSPA